MRAHRAATALLVLALATAACQAPGATRSRPGGVQASAKPFDHELFDSLLRTYDRDGKVDYRSLKADGGAKLKQYLELLGDHGPAFAGRDDELAYWLNTYNACVIAGVLERYPGIKSVMEVKDFFTAKRWKAAGGVHSLNEIEGLIRSEFKDPRVHFTLVCGARSCPPLQNRAMAPATLQAQLDSATRAAANNPKYVQIDPKAKRLRLTRIMSWYRQDFVDRDGSLEAFLMRYLKEPARSELKAGGYTIEFMEYDWALNDAGSQPTRRTAR